MPIEPPYYLEVTAENAPANAKVIHKFGRNTAVGTNFVPICLGGVYRTPQSGSATALRIKAGGNANDTAAGTGAREITLIGLDENFNEVSETLATNGISASSATTTTFTRLFRFFVSKSGTYATATAGSHSGDIVVEDSGGTEDWGTISATSFPRSQSEIGAYTVPAGKTAYLKNLTVVVESTKVTDILFFQRQRAHQTSAPYDAMRVVVELGAIGGYQFFDPEVPIGPFLEYTDIGFMGKVASGTAEVDVDFELILRDPE